ncbi:cell division protein CrgA [Bifidobacterium sp.]|jgi:hypothetical protein|uniref:cell division protein CrgA n=1 Tax=Bifidobacterium sp. TaxID=41200 RepID=UPI0025C2620D|nr:cell division protein CrgA [Bifidobacterium sp.]MCH4160254.1 cell division protein CrgA [Bifidobacterium sp.]MCH4175228.1 cell division protein CrgA [Bifidobacterium sp.]MCI1634877.1 cell division protein CrgA [Bifidobacterium sp.]
MAEQELHETDAQAQESKQGNESGADLATKSSEKYDTESEIQEDASTDETYGVSIDKVEAVLNSTVDKSALTPQMKRMIQRQDDNTKRVEESIKGTKANPGWFVPVFCAFMILGLIWCATYYLTGKYPIPNIDAWNLAIGFGLVMVGFIMTMWWR